MGHMEHNRNRAGRRPGDLIIDRYLKDASEEEREEAQDQLRKFALLLIEIGERITEEQKGSVAPAPNTTARVTVNKGPTQPSLFG